MATSYAGTQRKRLAIVGVTAIVVVAGVTGVVLFNQSSSVSSPGAVFRPPTNTVPKLGPPPSVSNPAVVTGLVHTCVLKSDSRVQCWGSNDSGQLGNGTNTDSNVPVGISVSTNSAFSIAAGEEYTCMLLQDAMVQCWGDNTFGQLGNGTNNNKSNVPVSVTGLTGATAIAAGSDHTCALMSGGTVQCWGTNVYGQLGNGSSTGPEVCIYGTACSNVPVTVTGLTGATAIAAGYDDTCALLSDATVQCWGGNKYGQLGSGSTANSIVPVTVRGLTGAIAITAGGYHTCALLSGGTVQCWGSNAYGQLGDGTNTDSNVPVSVTGLTGVTAISAGWYHTCALLSGGTVQCWGYNNYGQLGNGTNTNSNVPVSVTGLTGATAIAAGYTAHTCAFLSSGTVQCWGYNFQGQLGNGTNTSSYSPVSVTGL